MRGSTEEMLSKLQQIHFAPNPGEVFDWMLSRGIAGTLRAYGFDPSHTQSLMRQGRMRFRNGPASLAKHFVAGLVTVRFCRT